MTTSEEDFLGLPGFLRRTDATELATLREQVRVANERFASFQKNARTVYATVVSVARGKAVLFDGGSLVESDLPAFASIAPGAVVRLVPAAGQILNVVNGHRATGLVAEVLGAVDGGLVEVALAMGSRLVRLCGIEAEPGDRVLVDPTCSIAVRNLGPAPPKVGRLGEVKELLPGHVVLEHANQTHLVEVPQGMGVAKGDRVVFDVASKAVRNVGKPKAFALGHATGVSWQDVAGQDEAVRALREAIEEPVLHKDLYESFGKKRPKGALLHGPPGTGKTLLGKAAATALARLHGRAPAESGFQYVKAPEMLNKYIGQTEENVRNLFVAARAHFAVAGYPAVILVDEADAILAARGARGRGPELLERTVVPMFLAEMDGLDESCAFFILATNRPQDLDPAVLREGRVDRRVLVGRPDREAARAILRLHLRGRPVDGPTSTVIDRVTTKLFSSEYVFWLVETKEKGPLRFTLGDVASGAMVAGLVETATQFAIRRCKDAPDEKRAITAIDWGLAIGQTDREYRAIDHGRTLQEEWLPKQHAGEVLSIRRGEPPTDLAAKAAEKGSP